MLTPFLSRGHMGVGYYICLSGFVTHWAYASRGLGFGDIPKLLTFYKGRFGRVLFSVRALTPSRSRTRPCLRTRAFVDRLPQRALRRITTGTHELFTATWTIIPPSALIARNQLDLT